MTVVNIDDAEKSALEIVAKLGVIYEHQMADAGEALARFRFSGAKELRREASKTYYARQKLYRWIYEEAFKLAAEAGDEVAANKPEVLYSIYATTIKYGKYVNEKIDAHEL